MRRMGFDPKGVRRLGSIFANGRPHGLSFVLFATYLARGINKNSPAALRPQGYRCIGLEPARPYGRTSSIISTPTASGTDAIGPLNPAGRNMGKLEL
jgi:hypothetical protein